MQSTQSIKDHTGTLCVFIASLLHSINGLCMKFIPWNGMSINSARNLTAILVMTVFLWIIKHPPTMNLTILLGAISVTSTQVFFSLANKLTTAANAIVLQFTTPAFIILLSFLIWRKRPKKLDITACFMVSAGITCFLLNNLSAGRLIGNILALLSGLTNAIVYLTRDMKKSDQISSFFWGEFLSIFVGFPFLIQETVFSTTALASVLILGVLNVAFAHILLYIGMQSTHPVSASLIGGIEPILNPILVAIVFGETISPSESVGAVIVIVSVVGYNILKSRPQYSQKPSPK